MKRHVGVVEYRRVVPSAALIALTIAAMLSIAPDKLSLQTLGNLNQVEQFGRLEFRVRPCETLNQYGYAGPSERYVSLEEYLSADFDGRPTDGFRKDQKSKLNPAYLALALD